MLLKSCGHAINKMNSFGVLNCRLSPFLLVCKASNLLWWKQSGVCSKQAEQTSYWMRKRKSQSTNMSWSAPLMVFKSHLKWIKREPRIHPKRPLNAGCNTKTKNHLHPFLRPVGDSQCPHKGKRRRCKLQRKQPCAVRLTRLLLYPQHIKHVM